MVNVFNISPRYPFLDVLARYIIETARIQNYNVADDIVLLPTRRACRRLKEIFLNLSSEDSAILIPHIMPLGDVDEDGVAFLYYEHEDINHSETKNGNYSALPEAIDKLERNLLLAKIIKDKNEIIQDMSEEQAFSLAIELSHLIDTVEMEELSFSDLANIVPDEYSIHWQKTLDFLKIITESYPTILHNTLQKLDPVERKIALINKQVDFWHTHSPRGRIFAAGSTGSLVPISYMLCAIAQMSNGFVVLPGLDKNISEDDFNFLISDYPATNQNHPQYGMFHLIKKLGLKPSDIPDLPLYYNYGDIITPPERETLANTIMFLPDMNANWTNITSFPDNILSDVTKLSLNTDADEAFACACILRRAVEENKRALLITPDRKIAKSVAGELRRWDIIIDDSAGIPASDSITGNYLLIILKMIYDNFSLYSILAVLKHKYTILGYSNHRTLDAIVERLERDVLRGTIGLDTLDTIIAHANTITEAHIGVVIDLLKRIKHITAEYTNMMHSHEKFSIAYLFKKHLELVNTFMQNDLGTIDTTAILWNSSDIHQSLSTTLTDFAKKVRDIEAKNSDIDKMTARTYFTFISNYLLSVSLRHTTSTHPNIEIMNSIEARLIDADIYILAGLNEGIFPAQTAEDPWMSRPMRASFKLPLPERKIGLSSHDFVEFFCKKNIFLTHSLKSGSSHTETITSRWLKKLDAIVKLSGICWDNYGANDILDWVKNYEIPSTITPYNQPSPCPPLSTRPQELSATWVEKWYRDPYIIFAAKILGLIQLDDINPQIGKSIFGNIVHESLEEFMLNPSLTTADELYYLMIAKSSPYAGLPQIDFWYSQFKKIAKVIIDINACYTSANTKVYTEKKGKITISPNFTLTAKADRIDVDTQTGEAVIYDYKTGTVPSDNEVQTGYAPQLPIEAIILNAGGFSDIPRTTATDAKVSSHALRYIALSGAKNGDVQNKVETPDDMDSLLALTLKNIREMVEKFSNPSTPYISRPNPNPKVVGHSIEEYSAYNHLARIKEWQS